MIFIKQGKKFLENFRKEPQRCLITENKYRPKYRYERLFSSLAGEKSNLQTLNTIQKQMTPSTIGPLQTQVQKTTDWFSISADWICGYGTWQACNDTQTALCHFMQRTWASMGFGTHWERSGPGPNPPWIWRDYCTVVASTQLKNVATACIHSWGMTIPGACPRFCHVKEKFHFLEVEPRQKKKQCRLTKILWFTSMYMGS